MNLKIRNGVLGGLAGGVVFGMLIAMMGMLPMIASLMGSRSNLMSLMGHLIFGLILSTVYAVLSRRGTTAAVLTR